ncbi:type II toxin-antitoxin system RelE/ParE family toxin [Candidatus Sumerlaeota bacterium]|nr:type II toxin-antitoxin system RelE/ParE family toxin [Candidatus Sumerlaeota bacterium]
MRLTKHAVKDISSFQRADQRRIKRAIDGLAGNPRPRGCQKVRGKDSRLRIRIGRIRVIYDVNDKRRCVEVARVRLRSESKYRLRG